jgi:hypothetical protein
MSNSLKGAILNPAVVRGLSAYEIAVLHGFEGTEEEWLDHQAKEAAERAGEMIEGKLAEAIAVVEPLVAESAENARTAQASATSASESASQAAATIPSAQQAIENAKNAAVLQIESKVDDLLNVDKGTLAKISKTITTEGATWG